MTKPENSSLDILGVRPVANSIEKITDGVVDGARAFLSRICLPAAEEFGLLLQDQVTFWRSTRAIKLAAKAERKVIQQYGQVPVKVSPRIAHSILNEGSWIDDEEIHDMWAGLLASSCSEANADDSNIIFISLLKQLTSLQVRVIRYAVEESKKYLSPGGWPVADLPLLSAEELGQVVGSNNFLRLDRELDYLVDLGLIKSKYMNGGGFSLESNKADITPSALALSLYIRGEGFPGNPTEYWSLKKKEK